MVNSLLYPIDSTSRRAVSLDGMWGFQLDPEEKGSSEQWMLRLPSPDFIPVPSSFSDLYTDKSIREYCGDFWYEKDIFIPSEYYGSIVALRFGCATHTAEVWCNGIKVAAHEGGFLPFSADISESAVYGGMNHIAVRVNNELSETRMPCGTVKVKPDGTKRNAPYFDFFNYSGLQRSVWLISLPQKHIEDFDLIYSIDRNDAEIKYKISLSSGEKTVSEPSGDISVELIDAEGKSAAYAEGKQGVMHVRDAHLWQIRNAYLYTIVIRLKHGQKITDEYREQIGIRTVEIKGRQLLLNGKPVYLKGFGKHEDADIVGRAFSPSIMKRDFELMKWSGANSFRTSHYPYSEEFYRMADREGFLVIDEVQAVGCFPSLSNFADATSGKQTAFFAGETTPNLMAHHKQSIDEMIRRDKNHACVIAWSLLNEPETSDVASAVYFEEVFDYARKCDPQNRPMTFALMMNSQPGNCKCHQIADFLSFNRYYGWYILGGPDIDEAESAFRKEMDAWMQLEPDKPFVFTEYGADTYAAIDKLPSVMWSESYQIEMLEMCERVFDSYDSVIGEQVWNFADFQTTEGIMRVDGNKKGVFTRQRQPKSAAFHLKKRWSEKSDYIL